MLHNLFILDLIYGKRILLIFSGFLVLIFVLYPILMPEPKLATIFCLAYLGILPAMSLGKAHRYRTAVMTCSMPVTRAQVVVSKYLVSIGFCVAGILLFLLIMMVNPILPYPRGSALELQTISTGVFVLAVALGILFPLILRFGVMGIMIIMVGLQILGTVFLLLASRGEGFRSVIMTATGTIGGAFDYLRDAMGHPGYSLFLVAAGCALLAFSLLASIFVFRRKEL